MLRIWSHVTKHICLYAAATAVAAGLGSIGQAGAQIAAATVVVDWIPYQPHHMGFWLAKEKGWYAAEGIDVKIQNAMGSSRVVQVVTSGQADFGLASAATVSKAVAQQKAPVKMVAVFSQRDVLSMRYFVSSGIKTPKDLEGRKVGIVTGSLNQVLWPAFAKAGRFDAGKVQVIGTDFQSYNRLFVGGQFDATNSALGLPENIVLARQGKPVAEFVFSDYIPLIGHGVIVTEDMIAKRSDIVARFVRATSRAWAYMISNPRQATTEASAIIRKNVEAAPAEDLLIEAALVVVPSRMQSKAAAGRNPGWSSSRDWQEMIDLLAEYGELPSRPPVAELMTNRFVE